MVVNASDDAAQAYESNTDGSEWFAEANSADLDGSEWVDGLDEAGLENADMLDGDALWASEYGVTQDDADEYDSNTTAEAWAEGWGDASNWDV